MLSNELPDVACSDRVIEDRLLVGKPFLPSIINEVFDVSARSLSFSTRDAFSQQASSPATRMLETTAHSRQVLKLTCLRGL
ncbi:uncharacterized protein SETTUDRAFT_164074 [Exserohilum turcica Et28A]|uniref:Uncharacterized protein n=1 Tax=Exserohilum turcicum (strain 28A) TaxID=671987 RepID=R0IKP9_EXST2|nr:uncharacterized protein SETTUDRAFT_164074 [Exserohilum turcica Et28A]EOA85446.1 hypothetical protein SETTUDRAFT_164074 [Exserohilum turcica Et28A]